eukprot:CAMPEP_0116995308 /NCGR_PEP_ID=MMETSP0467-20121206/68674_1 /TAXON_ID=283647 /ORGANISM="Mesodinium pulex, Strain SPMC105" /LENGTH=57 /DNA_ID=CAMNT_0004693593 /DNA_START=447 /DNA_END=620 /DNA_ORIENTATION=+
MIETKMRNLLEECDTISRTLIAKSIVYGFAYNEESADITRVALQKLSKTNHKPLISE